MRVSVEWRSTSKDNYNKFKKKHPTIKVSFEEWKNIIYTFNYAFRDYILETGLKARMPSGFGEFSINKKKVKKIKVAPDGKEYINLPIDWKKTREKGKRIYNFNYHTEGYRFRWIWLKKSARFRNSDLWWFKPSRVSSRMINHYIKVDPKYQHKYRAWVV